MTKVKIFQPSKTATQSGKAKTKKWILETPQQRLFFGSQEEAIFFADSKKWTYECLPPHKANIRAKSYALNFLNPYLR